MENNYTEIPKVIHLCWFSGDKYPATIDRCIKSWQRVLPDYTIKLWDYEMAMSTKIRFVEEAIAVRKWAFAADVIRLHALYTEGGIYMDADVFLCERFDKFLDNKAVFFVECHTKKDKKGGVLKQSIGIQAAFFAAAKGSKLIEKLLSYYLDKPFIQPDGSYATGVIAPAIYAAEAEGMGFEYRDEKQVMGDVTYYPSRYIAGNRKEQCKESFGVHLCYHSWHYKSKIKELRHRLKNFYNRHLLPETKMPI